MNKHVIALFTACIISFSGWTQAVWQTVGSPIEENLVSVCFVDMDHGWILSEQGTLISTANGGQSWQTASLGAGTFTAVYFTDQDNGCITGYQDSSFIMLSTDGGANWQMSEHVKAEHLNDVYFYNHDQGWAVGMRDNMNCVLYTEDGGQSWIYQSGPFVQEAELFSISFRDGMSGSTCGAAGAFFITSSGGSSWALNISIPSLGVDINSVHNWGMFNGCAVGENGTALYTTSKWSSYAETTTNTGADLSAVSADPVTNKLWAAGESGTIIFTSNYLLGWITQTTGTTEDLADIDMIDESNGWAVGKNGTILRFGENTLIDEINNQHTTLKIDIYPNPTRGIFDIQFKIYNLQSVSIAIIDVHGQEVIQLLDTELQAGDHVVQANLTGLPEGVYFCKLAAGNRPLATGKIMKIH